MPTTCRRRVFGNMPIGVSVPCGVVSITSSPVSTFSLAARSLPSRMPSAVAVGRRVQRLETAASQRLLEVGDLRFERGVDALDLDRHRLLGHRQQALTENRRRGADDVREPAESGRPPRDSR